MGNARQICTVYVEYGNLMDGYRSLERTSHPFGHHLFELYHITLICSSFVR